MGHSYATKSNVVRKVKTPGGKLVLHNLKKQGKGVKCGDCGKVLQGLPAVRPTELKRIAKNKKTVARAYGGSRCSTCVRQRIVRAFLIESRRLSSRCLSRRRGEIKLSLDSTETMDSQMVREHNSPHTGDKLPMRVLNLYVRPK